MALASQIKAVNLEHLQAHSNFPGPFPPQGLSRLIFDVAIWQNFLYGGDAAREEFLTQ